MVRKCTSLLSWPPHMLAKWLVKWLQQLTTDCASELAKTAAQQGTRMYSTPRVYARPVCSSNSGVVTPGVSTRPDSIWSYTVCKTHTHMHTQNIFTLSHIHNITHTYTHYNRLHAIIPLHSPPCHHPIAKVAMNNRQTIECMISLPTSKTITTCQHLRQPQSKPLNINTVVWASAPHTHSCLKVWCMYHKQDRFASTLYTHTCSGMQLRWHVLFRYPP